MLAARAGDKKFKGGAGDDKLDGGWWGADRFVFDENSGHDTIVNFYTGAGVNRGYSEKHGDVIVIKGGKVFEDLTITKNEKGHAVVTGYGEDVSITLKGVRASWLTESDFEFLG